MDKTEDIQPMQGDNLALSVRDDAVVLPSIKQIDGKSEEFVGIVTKVLPDDVAPELGEMLRSRNNGYSRLGILGIIAFCVLSCVGAYYFWPRLPELESTDESIKVASPEGKVDSKYRKIYEESEALLKDKKYVACAQLLSPELDKIFAPGAGSDDWKGARKLFGIYLEAVNEGQYDTSNIRTASHYITKLQNLEPDAIEWPTYEVLISSKELLKDFEYVVKEDNVRLASIMKCLRNVDKVLVMDKDRAKGRNQQRLLLIKARLLTMQWILGGMAKGYPYESLNDVGVIEREKAYKIAKQYDNVSEFLELRLYILDKLIEYGPHWGIGKIYFGGKKVTAGALKNERKSIAARLGRTDEQ